MLSWYENFDGWQCGCITPVITSCTINRRFSPFCRIVDVVPSTPQVYFRVALSSQRDSTSLTFAHSSVYLELRRKGMEALLATYTAWRRDENGYVGFYFDDALFGQPPGFFIGDVYIDCKYCFSVQLRLPPCETFVTDCYVVPALEDCGRGECTVLDPVGLGVAGGLPCDAPSTVCGDAIPYFDLSNPVPPASVCGIPTACCFTPACAAGSVPIG